MLKKLFKLISFFYSLLIFYGCSLDEQAGKSPLSARQNPVVYLILVPSLIIIFFLLCIWVYLLIRKKRMESPEFLEKEKQRDTNLNDVRIFAQKFHLSQNEENTLAWLCKKYTIKNILYIGTDFSECNEVIREAYNNLKKDNNQEKINSIFSLKFALDKILASSQILSASKEIPQGTKLALLNSNGTKTKCELKENLKDYISIQISEDFYKSEEKPNETDKIAFTFSAENGMPYAFVTRLIRYQTSGSEYYMIVSHSKGLITKTARNFKRIFVNENCRIASVKTTNGKNGQDNYSISEQKINARLSNISGGGCCVISGLPIKEGQNIYVEIDFPDGTDYLIGKIVHTRKTSVEGAYNLHIRFVRISIETQNKILSKVYSFY